MSMQKTTVAKLLSPNQIMRVQIGDLCCSIQCHDAEVLNSLQHLYHPFLSDKPADINIELKIIDCLNAAEVEAAIPETRFIQRGNRLMTTSLIITGKHNLAKRAISMTAEKQLINSDLESTWINRGLLIAYYTACRVRYSGKPPALLVHSCGILRHGQALLFAGQCDAGKTTIARLCGEEYGRVLNDEMLLVSRPHPDNGALTVQGVPIIGGFPQRLNMAAPLRCILLLKQSNRTTVRRLDRMEAYPRFMRQVVSPTYIGQTDRRAVYSLIAKFSDEVTRVAPFYELEFTLDKESLWEVIGELEKSQAKYT